MILSFNSIYLAANKSFSRYSYSSQSVDKILT